MGRKAVAACVGEGMVVRRVVMAAREVVFFKGIMEANEGLAAVFAERGGELDVAAPADRERELDAVLDDLSADIRFVLLRTPEPSEADPAKDAHKADESK